MKDFYEHIDDYIKGRLGELDRQAMEDAMEQDPDLKLAIENHDALEIILDANIEDTLRTQLEKAQKNLDDEKPVAKETGHNGINKWWIVIGILLMASIVYILFQQSKVNNSELKYAALYELYEFPENRGTRSGELVSTKLDSAIYYFDLRNFELSEDLIDQVLNESPNNDDAVFYKAHLLFHSRDLDAAEEWTEKYNLLETELGKLLRSD